MPPETDNTINAGLREDISEIKTDQRRVLDGVAGLQAQMAGLNATVTTNQKEIARAFEEMGALRLAQNATASSVTTLAKDVGSSISFARGAAAALGILIFGAGLYFNHVYGSISDRLTVVESNQRGGLERLTRTEEQIRMLNTKP